ncbi:hypothetical protein SteCoe_1376 [Stentor coeruleus]|uniref:Uncharacterized protein n=1 Tax=Stentor coeruleus TaxID=5963 RepID=A0A1R2D282_9CILI|nr:hypothetical protein SteCoe_1376 [Stentor coeruleus]
MEEYEKPRRLKRLSEISGSIDDKSNKSSSESEDLSEIISISSESEDSGSKSPKAKTKKPKVVKNKAPKLPKFNKLLDLNTNADDFEVEVFEDLRDAPLELHPKAGKMKKNSFLKKVQTKKDETSYNLAKSVMINKNSQDTLIVDNPVCIQGFITKNVTHNPREIFRDNLKNVINERKTTHLDNHEIFDKTVTDFPIKEDSMSKKDEENTKKNDENCKKLDESNKKFLESAAKENQFLIPDDKSDSKSSSLQKNYKIETSKLETQYDHQDPELNLNTNSNQTIKNKSYPSTSASSPVYVPRERQVISLFIDEEAEKSGDDHSQDTDEAEHDKNLEGLIDDSELDDYNKNANYSKHIKEMLEKEREELKLVANAEFKRRMPPPKFESIKRKKLPVKDEIPKKNQVFSKDDDDSDEEERFKLLKEMREIRSMRNLETKTLIIDERSNDFLKLIERSEAPRAVKTFLNSANAKSLQNPFSNESYTSNPFFKINKVEKNVGKNDAKQSVRARPKLLNVLRNK